MTSVTVVIPAFNEGPQFASTLVSVADYFSCYRGAGYDFRYLVIDDGSADETTEAAESFARFRPNVRVIRHPQNRGLGAALRTAFSDIHTDLALVLDADLSYPPDLGMRLVETLERDDRDIVTASPYMRGGAIVNVPWMRRVLSREANRLLSLATSGKYATMTCMVRAYRREAIERVTFESDGMDAIAEMLLDALRKGLRVSEVPATLRWSAERRASGMRIAPARLARQIWRTSRLAFSFRPALWLAVPGLIPGLLPVVVAVLLVLRVSPSTLALGTAITIIVQYASLAIFAGQLGAFFARRLRTPRSSEGVETNGYHAPKRSA